ncbi:DUF943 family protein [Erwiniaceae bacterium BAC15a-03b]|uniref:DUF943 family protein n=1 Tax=Winslowiella arboricola TaxID=2978220 RepID=A0A9J6PFM3_9GAMM|nr:DUF943 family protein [Winslowiella arboricola]MCU5772314.1 DUF943 family protein [Winslowiella arboricola]MCU5776178.1 DUF943 family protein [Winslowiella arboricola]
MTKYRKIMILFIIILCAIYIAYELLKPVKIIAIYQYRNSTDILIENPPITDAGKIKWWQHNINKLEEEKKLSPSDLDGTFYINIWDFGDGYKTEGNADRLCFDAINSDKKCIDKNKYMTIYRFKNEAPIFTIGDNSYIKLKNGEIVRQ